MHKSWAGTRTIPNVFVRHISKSPCKPIIGERSAIDACAVPRQLSDRAMHVQSIHERTPFNVQATERQSSQTVVPVWNYMVLYGTGAWTSQHRVRGSEVKRHMATTSEDTTLDQYEGQSQGNKNFKDNYLNPDAKPSNPDDAEFEHPADLEMPVFHPMPQRGFMSDPCGPMYDPNHDRLLTFLC